MEDFAQKVYGVGEESDTYVRCLSGDRFDKLINKVFNVGKGGEIKGVKDLEDLLEYL